MRQGRTKAGGQALVLFLGVAAALIGMLLVAFNSGQVTNAKMRAMNAADAAAYSGAVWQARSLNFQAYMNRAMIVNEVTIAQSVSLRSWIDYLSRLVTNINAITQFIPIAGQVTRTIERVLSTVDRTMQQGLPLFEAALRGLNRMEHVAQLGFHHSGALVAAELAHKVAQRNGARVSAGGVALFAKNELAWRAFTDTYTRDKRKRLKDVTLDSRDGFTTRRDRKIGLPLIAEFRKQGGTDLIGYDAWKGLDSAELRSAWTPKGWKVKLPVGYGGAQSHSTPRAVQGHGRHGDINEWNNADGRKARSAANRSPGAARNVAPFPDYRDIVKPAEKNPDLRLPFGVEVVIGGAEVPTARSAMGARTMLTDGTVQDQDPQYQGNNGGVYALAEACVRFARPHGAARSDGGKEFPSLFNPYWRAEMATESGKSRLVADAPKALLRVTAFFERRGSCE